MGGSGLHGLGLNSISLVTCTVADDRPRKSSGVHGAFVACLALSRLALGFLHAEDERPGSLGGVTSGDRVDVSRQLVLGAQL